MSDLELNVNNLKSIENIQKLISHYREEQEKVFIKNVSEISHSRDNHIDNIFEHCCIISVVRRASSYQLGLWPQCIVGSIGEKCANIGSFESYGSLWRFLKLEESQGTLKVAIECSVRILYEFAYEY